jgi:hypothetical protein
MQRLLRSVCLVIIILSFSFAQEQSRKHVINLTDAQSLRLHSSFQQYLDAKAAYQTALDEIKTATPEAACSSEQVEISADFKSLSFAMCESAPEGPKAGYPLPMRATTPAQERH